MSKEPERTDEPVPQAHSEGGGSSSGYYCPLGDSQEDPGDVDPPK
jgi:hypothetical protein